MKYTATAITLLLAATLCLAQSASRQQSRPNIVFILIDDLRGDELGIAGHPFIQTPHIDRIAREGARFRHAFMTTPLCSPLSTLQAMTAFCPAKPTSLLAKHGPVQTSQVRVSR